MTLEYTNTVEDIQAFNAYHYKHSPTMQRQRLNAQYAMTFLYAVAYGITVILLAGGRPNASPDLGVLYLGIGIAGAIVVFFASRTHIESRFTRNVEKLYKEGKNTSLLEPRSVTIEADGIKHQSPSSEGNIKWSAVEKVVATDTHLFLYINAMAAIAIPKRAPSNESDWNDLVKRAQTYQQSAAIQ